MIAYLHLVQDGAGTGGYYLRVNDHSVAFVNYTRRAVNYFHGRGVVTCDGFTTAKDTHAALQALAALRFGVTEIRFEQSNTVPFTE
jgi:hypothetical protein